MRRFLLFVFLLLLLHRAADALRVTSAQLSNATASAPTELVVVLNLDGATVTADAVFTVALDSKLSLYDATTSDVAAVDTALLATQLDGDLQIAVSANAISITRGTGATEITLADGTLTLRFVHLTASEVAETLSLGSLSLGNAGDAIAYGQVTLPSVWIAPGQLWNAQIGFSNLISSRMTAFNVSFTPANAVPANGSIFIHLPPTYSASRAVLDGITIVSSTGVDGTLRINVVDSALRLSWALDAPGAIGGLYAMQLVLLEFDGLQHPALEGPIGRSSRIETADANLNVMDQALIDVSDVFLAHATVQLTKRQLFLQEAGGSASYALSLSAPPEFSPGLSVAISARLSDPASAASGLIIDPSLVQFSASNWSTSVSITVRAQEDDVALSSNAQFILSHAILDAATETSFAPVDDVVVEVQDDDLPLVHLSSRYVAVAESLRNDSYTISLLARPSSDVTIDIDSPLPFISVIPATLTFTPSSWSTAQTVHVQANAPDTSPPSSVVRSVLTHRVSSSDTTFVAFVPQDQVLVYYESLELVSCAEPCRPGWYPALNSSSNLPMCVACPLGSYCPGACTLPIPCGVGNSSSTPFATNSSVCVDCTAGSYALYPGQSLCTICPSGAACPHKNATGEPCPVGTFALEGQSLCRPCPAGTFCNSTFRERCDACPIGSYCAGGTALPMVCANGTYSVDGGARPCDSCAAGYACSNNSVTMACPNGTYALAGDDQCHVCPQGYYCPSTALAPIKCGQGTYSLAGATACTVCPFGHTCALPDLPKACGVGEISNGNHSACVTCPPGYACPIGGEVPVQCAAGTFSTGGALVCTSCAAGYACPDPTSTQRVPCLAGTYSSGGAASCSPCPAGFACATNTSVAFTPCPTGWFSPEGSAACTECPRGYYCDVPFEIPKNCTVGSYSTQAATSCTPCDPGYECPRSDQLPQPCPVGYYSGGNVANCKACRPGYKCGLASTNPTPPEDACPMGGYCNPPTTFFLCPAGTYGNVTAGESVDQACAPCPGGFYCEMGSTPLTKQNCPAGYVCPVGTKRGSQFPCPAGTFSPLPNQDTLDVCQLCPAGSFCVQGSANPVACPLGYYCPEGTMSANQYPCPAGTYSGPQTGLVIASQCKACELGTYCPEASSSPTACPAGSYNPTTGAATVNECLDCPPGWSCPRVGQFEYTDRCAKGHYCPSATVVATARPCPAGTFTDRIDLIRIEDCTICPLRHACPEGTGGETQTMLDCGPGFFCPNGTAYAKQFPCPPGYWSSSTSLADATECDICPVGHYCSGGKSMIDGPCSPGYYCPLGTPSPTKFPCPSGTFTAQTWLFDPSQCDDCPPGSYCPAGSVAPIACKPGSFSSFNNTKTVGPGVTWPDCVSCPAGSYCPEGAVTPLPCGKGFFSTKGSKVCTLCEAGYFCNSNTTSDTNMHADVVSWLAPGSLFGKCYNGTYCPPGSDHEPALQIDACPRGYFCPKATPAPVICPAGTYSNLTGQDEMSDCIPTPAGSYSLEGSLQPTGPCDPGFYCPLRSTSRTQIPCPARYYLNRTGGQSEDDCAVCVAGSYCPSGSAYPIACPTGAYCRTGVATPEPCPIGTYSNATSLKHVDNCLVCPPGMYCDSTGLTVPRGPCDPGYYCTLGSYTSAPMSYETTLFGVSNRNVGGQCPPGAFCPLGSAVPSPCPPRTFNNRTGLEMETQCVPCPPGQYCDTPGLVLPTGDCFSGYYCVGGASTPTQNATPPGTFTGNGSTAPVPCPAGQFNTYGMQERCVLCPAGFFCGSPGTIRPTICPLGHFCPEATALAIKCPPTTFNGLEGLVAGAQCQPCPAGFFCDSYGLTAPSGPCFEGFVCVGASPVSNPVASAFGFVCPAGFYCPAGSGAATPCPRGSFRATPSGTCLASCASCPGGSYCNDTALTAPSGPCPKGYFCTLNVSTATPSGDAADGVGGPCPLGSFCPEGSSQPQLCPEGTYADELRSPVCTQCPAGFFCPLGSTTYAATPCPQGYYCPIGTQRSTQFPCLPGTYGNRTGLTDLSECTPAPGGTYIEGSGATKATGLCKSGFYCAGGSASSTPATTTSTGGPCLPGTNCPEGSAVPIVCDAGFYCSSSNTDKALPCDAGFYCVQGSFTANPTGQNNSLGSIGDVCTPGHYCPQGTSNPIPCPPGTYSETPQNTNPSQCLPCRPGFVCRTSGIVAPYEKCPAGFVCTGGESDATQLCPRGHECPLGTSVPSLCPPGTFSDVEGLGQCKLCPARYYSVAGTVSPAPCPLGFYCPLQTPTATKFPCLPGTFGNATLLASAAECAACLPGQFCSGSAPTYRPSGACAPGFYCSGGAATATPTDGTTGDRCAGGFVCLGGAWLPDPIDNVTGRACDPGFYCPRGSSSPVRCAKGSYNPFEKQATCLPCPAGGYCDTNATTPVPCPLRYYCPDATVEPILCPSGTYGHAVGLASVDQCAPCAAGKFCVGGTLTASCSAGYYCKVSNAEPTPLGHDALGGPCPIGHYCPEGVLDPLPCPNATARLETLGTSVDDCGPCPAGMSCVDGAVTVPCPAGHYCAYAQSAVVCPAGTFNPLEGQAKLSDCRPCTLGKLCNATAIVDLTEYYDCPVGHYCLEASTMAIPCPEGRYRRTRGATAVDDCALCTGGSYCSEATVEPVVCPRETYCPVGSGAPIPCPGGSYCPSNATLPVVCPTGFYCPQQVALPIECARGFYCPDGSVAPLACPLGFIGRVTPLSGVLSRLTDACEPCPPGTYGIDPNRTRCDVCTEGYVCLEATRARLPISKDDDHGYTCPPGYYCPAGSSKELPCPSGTYQPSALATNVSDCRLCPANSYQNTIGQASCLPCSKSAFSSAGATVCTCKGSHRAFQMTDGYCICEPGYEFYDQDMVLRSDEDDDVDCQPIVYDRCGANQVRSDSGACVPASQSSCLKSCGNSTGTLVASLGICQCDKQADVDTVCDKACRDAAPQLQVDPVTRQLLVFNPVTGATESLADKGIVSKVSCTSDQASDCQLQTVALTSGGFTGSYDAPTTTTASRRLTTTTTPPVIANPMVCLHVGQGIYFDLSTPGSYPIYLKDSMLNTNPTFDYGAFRALATKVKSNESTVAALAFSFTEPGIYVFGNSLNGAAKTVITVMMAGTACPTEAPIVPLSEKNLISVSVKRRSDDLILAPDWGLILGLLGGLVGLVVAVIAGLYYFRTKSWATSSRRLLGYRAASKATDLATMHSKGVATAANKATLDPSPVKELTPAPVMVLDDGKAPAPDAFSPRVANREFHPDLARWEEEDLDLRELVDRLQQHHDAVTKCFDDQKGDVQSLLQHLQTEAADLKQLLVHALESHPPTVAPLTQEPQMPAQATAIVTPQALPPAGRSLISAVPEMKPAVAATAIGPAAAAASTLKTAAVSPTTIPAATTTVSAPTTKTTVPSAAIPSLQLSPATATALPSRQPSARNVSTTVPPADLQALRRATEAEAVAMATRQAQMQQEYVQMLETEFPQLSDDARQRLVDEFAADVGRMASALSVEAQKTKEDVENMLTARTVVAESRARAMAAVAEEQKRAVEQDQQRRLTTLESKYAEEEDAIEQEYQRELQRLEQEFAGMEGGGDETARPEDEEEEGDEDDEMAFGDGDDDGDAVTRRIDEDNEEEEGSEDEEEDLGAMPQSARSVVAIEGQQLAGYVGTSDALKERRMPSARRDISGPNKPCEEKRLPSARLVDHEADRARDARKQRLLDKLRAAKVSAESTPGGNEPMATPVDVAVVDAVENEIAKVHELFASSLDDQKRHVEQDAETKKRLLRERLAARKRDTVSNSPTAAVDLQAEEATALEMIETQLHEAIAQLETELKEHEAATVERMESAAVETTADVDGLLAACRAQHEKEAAALRERLARERQNEEAKLKARLAQRRNNKRPHDADAGAPDVEEAEWQRLQAQLEQSEATATRALLEEQRHQVAAVLGGRRKQTEEAVDRCRDQVQNAETELVRLRTEHAEGLATLQDALETERRQQSESIARRLATRRMGAKYDSDTSPEQLEAELQQLAEVEREQNERKRVATIASAMEEFQTQETAAQGRLMKAVGAASVALAAQTTLVAAEHAEADRLYKELVGGQENVRREDATAAEQGKGRLRDRLARRRQAQERSGDSSKPTEAVAVDVAAAAVETAIDNEVKRLHNQHNVDIECLQKQLEHEAERRKVALRDRLAKKKAAAATLRSRIPESTDVPTEQQLQAEEDAGIAAIEHDVSTRLHAAQATAMASETHVRDRAEEQTASKVDDLEAQLLSCRAQYEHDAAALQERLAQERQQREHALRDRLAARRAHCLVAIPTARDDAGIAIAPADQVAIEAELEMTANHEVAEMEAELAASEGARVEELEEKFTKQIDAIATRVKDEATAHHAAASDDNARATAELERLRDEHARALAALTAAHEADRQSQQQRLRDKLAQRRAATATAEDTSLLDAQDALEMAALTADLDAAFEAEAHAERERQDREQAAALAVVSDAQSALAASEATRQAADAARDAEHERLARELTNALRRVRDEDQSDAAKRKLRLAQRLEAKKNKAIKTEPSPQAVASSVLDRALADTQRQFDEGYQARLAEINAAAATRKASLRSRIASKRQALEKRADAAVGSARAALEGEEATQREAIEKLQATETRVAEETVAQQQREIEEVWRDARDDVESLVDACHASHDRERQALQQSLEQERQRREAALRDRLAKRRHDKTVELEKTLSGKSPEDQRHAREALEQELATDEKKEQERLQQALKDEDTKKLAEAEAAQRQDAIEKLDEVLRAAQERKVAANAAHDGTEAELRRIRDEHERNLETLRASLGADRRRQAQRLEDKLAARRAQRRSAGESDDAIQADEEHARVEWENEMEEHEAAALAQAQQRFQQEEQRLVVELTAYEARAAAAVASAVAIDAAREAELARIAAEFNASRERLRDDETADALARNAKLQNRLAQKRRREKPTTGSPDTAEAREDPKAVVAEAIDGAIDEALARTRQEFAMSLERRNDEINAVAAARKATLRERMALKRQALAMRAAAAASGPERDAIVAEQAALEATEAAADAAIDTESESRKREVEERATRQHDDAEASLRAAADSTNDDLERLLQACKAAHDEESKALHQRLEIERQQREAALRDRLAKRRVQKLAEATEALKNQPPKDQEQALATLNAELAADEERERAHFTQTLKGEEAKRLVDAEARQQQQSTEKLDDAERAARERQDAAHAAQAETDAELQRVRDEHERELLALKASLDAERQRQELKLRDKLAAKRAAQRAQGVSDEALAVEESLALVELKDELAQRAASALDEERQRQAEKEEEIELELARRAAQAAAVDAERLAIDAARAAERERIMNEFEASRRRLQDDVATDAEARKTKLAERLAQRKRREKPRKEDKEDAAAVPTEAKAVAAVVMDGAVDDALARIQSEYAKGLARRVAQLQDEAAVKKAALRDRIEQKRRALAMRQSPSTEKSLQEEQAAVEAAIDEELTTKTRAATEENERQQRAAHEALEVATTASAEELERLLDTCQRSHAADADALRRALEQERLVEEQNLKDRLAKRREEKLRLAKDPAAVEKELAVEAEKEQLALAQALADEEARRLQEAEEAQRRQAAEMMEKIEQETQARGDQARAAQVAAEDELRRIHEEHECERVALLASLETERKRQEQRLQEKLAARHTQRKSPTPPDEAAAEEALERMQLEEELQTQAAQALGEAQRRQHEQEQALAQQIAIAAAEANAADAAKRAIDAARAAEIERISNEFDASRRRAVDDEAAEADTRRSKLEERLAQKKRKDKKKKESDVSIKAATKKVMTVQKSLRSMTESHAEKEIERLRGEHAAACDERFAALEQDAALRKARLAVRIAAKRKETKATERPEEVEASLAQELEAETRAIDEALAVEKQKILNNVATAQEHVTASVQAAVQRSADEMEQLLASCKQAHDQETANLKRTLELERQRQEKTLRDRIAKRKQQRQQQQEQQQSQETAAAANPIDDAEEEEREKRELAAQLEAKEAQVWDDMRRKQEDELTMLTKQAEAAARQKQEEAKLVQESAQNELERLKREHEAEMATLTASLEAEQKRQQQQLQQRIAARRTKQQKQQKETDDVAEQERLAAQLAEQEAADKRALEQQLEAELAKRIEQERERQRQQEEELANRIAQANIEAAAAEAARLAMDAARAHELERLATEFDEKSRELRETHMTDLMNQKQKLEARVAAKKQKKLMELEAKRERERQLLREKIEQEERAAAAEQQRVDESVAMAAGDGTDGDASMPPMEPVEPDESTPLEVLVTVEETVPTPPIETVPVPVEETVDSVEEADEPMDEATRKAQEARDVAAIQQLIEMRVVPTRMPLLAAIELVLSQRHQTESSHLLAQQFKRKTHALRTALRDLLHQKAAAKALVMQQHPQDGEPRLQALDSDFDTRIRTAEASIVQSRDADGATQLQRLKAQQMAELQFLLQYFSGAVVAMAAETVPTPTATPQRVVMLTGTDTDMDDLIHELRARLQLEADDRIQQLLTDKTSDLERLETEFQAELQRLRDDFNRLVEQETAAMHAAYVERARGVTASSRGVLEKEKDAQVARLVLMLNGRRTQDEARAQRLVASKRATLKHEYDRKIEIVTAKMRKRIVEEKELLKQKDAAVAKAAEAPADDTRAPSGRGATSDTGQEDLRHMLVQRLQTIEELLRDQEPRDKVNSASATPETSDVVAYKQALVDAIDGACQWNVEMDASATTVVSVVPQKTLDATMQTQVDFANALVKMMGLPDGGSGIDHVAVAAALPRPQDSVMPRTLVDAATRTLWIHVACVDRLSVGQLALLVIHGVAEAQTKCHDVSDLAMIACVYRLLVQCYQHLFQQSTTAATVPPPTKASTPVAVRVAPPPDPVAPAPTKWKTHVYELETFLSSLDHLSPTTDAVALPSSSTLPQPLRRQTTHATLSLSSSRLLQASNNADMDALAVDERRQFLQEKLDAAEKLYAHVLRQHTEQKQAREFVHELREQANDSDDSASKAARLDELQREAEAMDLALDKTRKERDELFAQCQQLRDELEHLV